MFYAIGQNKSTFYHEKVNLLIAMAPHAKFSTNSFFFSMEIHLW